MIPQEFLGEYLVVGNLEASWVTPRERLVHELQVTQHVRNVNSLSPELLQEIESDVGLPIEECGPNRRQIIDTAEQCCLVLEPLESVDDVVFGLPRRNLFFRQSFHAAWKLDLLMSQN